ncbi:MAG: pimeloyl-ACP methyl esterase BioG family protein [Psychrilyobacter sp.]|uniref:pimeloyl-ACP methyl esterase BioG family protein n=1 Tax=Psychrilyobacter sp. TaxID=2586924 RepID=UPI003C739052
MKLILFFNGWGVPRETFKFLTWDDFEVKIIDLEEKVDLENLKKYNEINVIAWSFGVYNASKQLGDLKDISLNKVIAINGSTKAIHRRYGISPMIFNRTLENLDRSIYLQFMKNTGLENLEVKGEQIIKKYRDILAKFGEDYQEIPSIFKYSLISTKDRIFLSRSLINYYKETEYKLIEEEHYPFDRWNSWGAILDEF